MTETGCPLKLLEKRQCNTLGLIKTKTKNFKNGTLINTERSETDSNKQKVQKKRTPLFVYPALPKWEITLCFAIVISALLYGWWSVWRVSQLWTTRIVDASAMRYLPYFGWRYKDEINWEWHRWSPMAFSYLPYLLAHSLLFNLAENLISHRHAQSISISFSLFVSINMFGSKLVLFSVIQGLFLFTCTLYSRRTLTVWLSALPSLYLIMNHSSLLSEDIFHVLLFASYTMLSYISFCLDWTRNKVKLEELLNNNNVANIDATNNNNNNDNTKKYYNMGHAFTLLKEMFFYAFYQPYLFSLIVTYTDFARQYAQRPSITERNFRALAWRSVRVAFWWLTIEFMLHFFYFESIVHDDAFFLQLPKNDFVTMGMALGAFFHLKYVVIFGLPALFALIDGMRPPSGPICISRVALYSKIWRGFDRGLYAFFKSYIFLPICAPTFTVPRRIMGVLISYLFVLIWHGFHHQNLIWIGLNIIELFIEYSAKYFYTIPAIYKWRERHFSECNFRRILGVLQIVPFAFGLYSNFYFLGGSRVGWLYVQKIFLEETVTLRWPFFLLIFIGYFYMQVTMEFERYYADVCTHKLIATDSKTIKESKKDI